MTLSKECVDIAISVSAHHSRVDTIRRLFREDAWDFALRSLDSFDEWTDRDTRGGIFNEDDEKALKRDSIRLREALLKHNSEKSSLASSILYRTTFDLMFNKVCKCECKKI